VDCYDRAAKAEKEAAFLAEVLDTAAGAAEELIAERDALKATLAEESELWRLREADRLRHFNAVVRERDGLAEKLEAAEQADIARCVGATAAEIERLKAEVEGLRGLIVEFNAARAEWLAYPLERDGGWPGPVEVSQRYFSAMEALAALPPKPEDEQ